MSTNIGNPLDKRSTRPVTVARWSRAGDPASIPVASSPVRTATRHHPHERRWLAGAGGLGLAVAGYALPHADDLSPAGSAHDPAVLLAVLGGLLALRAALTGGNVPERWHND